MKIRQLIKRSFIYKFIKPILNYFWIIKGKPLPPPHFVKSDKILSFSKSYHVETFIETGTFRGDMVFATKKYFKKIISIELDSILYKNAVAMFVKDYNVEILNGNSKDVLPELLVGINQSCIFWLDGHYSGPGTSSGNKETPIIEELSCIINHEYKHIILIDDAHCFNGSNDYPTIERINNFLSDNNKKYTLRVEDNIIIIV